MIIYFKCISISFNRISTLANIIFSVITITYNYIWNILTIIINTLTETMVLKPLSS